MPAGLSWSVRGKSKAPDGREECQKESVIVCREIKYFLQFRTDLIMNQTRDQVWYVPVLATLLGGAMFLFIHGYKILDPTFICWIQGDGDSHFLGWQFFRSEPWTFPIGAIKSFFYPDGTSVVFTDSIPLVAIFHFQGQQDTPLPDGQCWALQNRCKLIFSTPILKFQWPTLHFEA